MSRLKLLKAKELEKLLVSIGFKAKRQKGSHKIFQHEDGRYTVIPMHGNKEIVRPLLVRILNEIDVSVDEYNELVK